MSVIRVKKLNPNAMLPTYGSSDAVGADLYACLEEADTICPGETTPITVTTAMSIAKKFLNFFCIRIPLFPNRYSLYLRKFPATHNAGKKRMSSPAYVQKNKYAFGILLPISRSRSRLPL